MEVKHIINENLKRLEPIAKHCVYCGERDFEHVDSCYFVPLFAEKDRTNVIVYRQVKFSKILIGIPRCQSCMEIHDSANNKGRIIAWSIGFLIIALAIFTMQPYVIAFGILAGLLAGFGLTIYIADRFIYDKGLYNPKQGAKNDETVQELVINGWSFTQPSA